MGSKLAGHRTTMRPRREVSRVTLALLRPFFRYSERRGAWVLRGVGNRRGPVLVIKVRHEEVDSRPVSSVLNLPDA